MYKVQLHLADQVYDLLQKEKPPTIMFYKHQGNTPVDIIAGTVGGSPELNALWKEMRKAKKQYEKAGGDYTAATK